MEDEGSSHSEAGLGLPVQGLLKNHWGCGFMGTSDVDEMNLKLLESLS